MTRAPVVDFWLDGPVALPTATLHAAARARHRLLVGHLRRWLDERWLWLRPRSVPMLAAFVAMLAMVGAMKRLSAYMCFDESAMHARVDLVAPRAMETEGRRLANASTDAARSGQHRVFACRLAPPLDEAREQPVTLSSDPSTPAPTVERESWGSKRLVPITIVAAPR